MEYNLDNCLACNICNLNCPVMAVHPEFKGPKLSGPAYERFRINASEIDENILLCSNCKTCDTVCPANVPIASLNMKAKANYYKYHKHSLSDWILSNGEKLGKFASLSPYITNFSIKYFKKTLKLVNISNKAPLPKYSKKNFYQEFKKIKQQPFEHKVLFYPGCFINFYQPEVGIDLVKLLQKIKIEVIVDERFICCGSPYVSNGYLDIAKNNAIHNFELLKYWIIERKIPVLALCTTCSLMLRQEYQELFDMDEIKTIANNIYDAGEYLLKILPKEIDKIKINKQKLSEMIYHAPCHLKVQGIGLPFYEILTQIIGMNIQNADAGCCGISGNYGFKDENYNTSMKVGNKLFDKIEKSKADVVLSECGTCRIQIEHGSQRKTEHPVTILEKLIS